MASLIGVQRGPRARKRDAVREYPADRRLTDAVHHTARCAQYSGITVS